MNSVASNSFAQKFTLLDRYTELQTLADKSVAENFNPKEVLTLISSLNKRLCDPPLDPGALENIVFVALKKRALESDPIYRLAENWLSEPEIPPDQIVAGLFDKGDKVVIIGKSKARKSFFVQQMAFSLVTGRSFLEFEVPQKRKVLLIQFEVKKERYKSRCIRMCSALDIAPSDLNGLVIVNARGLQHLASVIESQALLHAPDVIIVDPFYKLVDGDENKAEDIKPILKVFDSLAERTGAAVVYLHHDKKGSVGESDLTDRGAGSGVLARDFDSALLLSPHKQSGDMAVLEFVTRNYRSPEAFSIDWNNYSFSKSQYPPEKETLKSRTKANQLKLPQLVQIASNFISEKFAAGKRSFPLTGFRQKLTDAGIPRNAVTATIEELIDAKLIEIEIIERTKGQVGATKKNVILLDPVFSTTAETEFNEFEEVPF